MAPGNLSPLGPDPDRVTARLRAGQRPYVTLKAAATLDGKIATRTGMSRWITGEEARAHAHRVRAGHGAVLVGHGTVRADNPRLTVRLEGSGLPSPTRVVLASRADIAPEAHVLAEDGVRRIVVAGRDAEPGRVAELEARGVEVILCDDARPHAAEFLPRLREAGIESLLVEGGAEVHSHLIAHSAADELLLYLAGCLVGDRDAPDWCGALGITDLAQAPRLELVESRLIGADLLVCGLFHGS